MRQIKPFAVETAMPVGSVYQLLEKLSPLGLDWLSMDQDQFLFMPDL